MKYKKPKKSVSVSAGTRVYYMDAYEDPHGNPYLSIREKSTLNHGNQTKTHRILIFDEDLDKFSEAFAQMMKCLRDS